ncbi:MAG: Crp/Fnr family transcriptional regulator [Calditrichaeota bacterium]|nr:MAG: Crp/Fnr family transcriptional regulator [Calditrichota bacterium]
MLTVVEKVIFLQDVDIFEFASSEDLSYIAMITEEMTFPADEKIYSLGDASEAMFLVIDGKVRLHRNGDEVMIAQRKDVFGTWALFDDEPRIVTATCLQESHLLRIEREDFFDLLADHQRITEGILKSMSKRLRALLTRTA